MSSGKYSELYPNNHSNLNQLPPPHPVSPNMPNDADAAYLYSSLQDRKESSRRTGGVFQSSPDSSRKLFTQKLPLDLNLRQHIAEWQQKYPDGAIVGYHTPGTKEVLNSASPPVLHHARRAPTP